MTTRALALLPGLVTTLWIAGCAADDTAAGGRGGEGGGGGAPGGAAGGPTAGGGKMCGGEANVRCPSHEYCDFLDNGLCGTEGGTGVCRARPETCAQHCGGVCGCDGQLYCNDCMANAAGADVARGLSFCSRVKTCADVVDHIADQAQRGGTCASVVRLDHETRSVKSAHTSCAPAKQVSAVDARRAAQRETGIGEHGQLLSGLGPVDEYVFWEPPSERGGVAVVNARNGAAVFGGSIVWGDAGQVVHPVAYHPPAVLGPTCGSSAPMPPARGLRLDSLDEMPAAEVQSALAALWVTALPDGLAQRSQMLDAMVLLYPPQVGPFDPAIAEWIVILNSQALE